MLRRLHSKGVHPGGKTPELIVRLKDKAERLDPPSILPGGRRANARRKLRPYSDQ